jgi:ParB family chromosome partitioning protein
MASTKKTLDDITTNLEESMGVRKAEIYPVLAPAPGRKDAGRRPVRNFGRIAIGQVIPDPHQPRKDFAEDELNELALSIREKGQLTPIRVRWSESLEKWIVIFGERRWRAAQHAGLTEIDCYFHEGDLSESEILEQQLIENCLRIDLHPIEEAKAFAQLIRLNDWTAKRVADELRVHPSRVSRALALLRLPEDLQEQVESGRVAARSAYELSKLADPNKQAELAQEAAAGNLPPEKAARAVRQRLGKAKPQPRSTTQTFFTEGGWKVVVSAPKKGSYFEIEQALCEALEEVRVRINSGCQIY